jgi:hypothetical protein
VNLKDDEDTREVSRRPSYICRGEPDESCMCKSDGAKCSVSVEGEVEDSKGFALVLIGLEKYDTRQ